MMKIKILLLTLCINSALYAQVPADLNINANLTFNGEQSMAMHPNNPAHLVVAWMKYIFAPAPAGMMIATSTSTNGGLTWSTPVNIPHFRPHWTSADPTLAFNTNGDIYLGYIDYKIQKDSGAVYVAKSTNGGTSWGTPSKVIDFFDNADLAIDRPWIAVDNSGGAYDGNVYCVTMSIKEDPLPHHNYLMKSTNGGNTWSAPLQIDVAIPGGPTVKPMGIPCVSKNGKLNIAYFSYNPPQSLLGRFICASSIDGGNSLSAAVIQTIGATPITNDTLLQYSYHLAANPTNSNNLVFTYVDKSNNDYDINSAYSNDGGNSWSNAQRITNDLINNGNNQDMCWAGFSSTGKYAGVWRDRRANSGAQNQPYKIWGSLSVDGGANFTPNFQVSQSDGPLMIPVDGNDFLGCVLNDTVVYSCWTDKRNGSTNQLYFNKYKMSQITGLAKNKLKEGIIFPNPNNGEFTILFEDHAERNIQIFDVNGKLVYAHKNQSDQLKIKLKECKGNYFVKMESKGEIFTVNMLVE
ncbi:MAG: T9SS type A sorting domain-containing protein [Sphingobacteriaceae bacterium]|nr:T9SS type A sorting domain-containing protein [Sphingobacteriaceae bacterium]